mmetsp:Transcript_22060/g.39107  ORF Transcript_22060/g.39107 Transcript_22060/m.39107 type:complete len:246 (+) Transcript_22060:116-853(+)
MQSAEVKVQAKRSRQDVAQLQKQGAEIGQSAEEEFDVEDDLPVATVVAIGLPVTPSVTPPVGSATKAAESYSRKDLNDYRETFSVELSGFYVIAALVMSGLVTFLITNDFNIAFLVGCSFVLVFFGFYSCFLPADIKVHVDEKELRVGTKYQRTTKKLRSVRSLEISVNPHKFRKVQDGRTYIFQAGPTIIATVGSDELEFSCTEPERFIAVCENLRKKKLKKETTTEVQNERNGRYDNWKREYD